MNLAFTDEMDMEDEKAQFLLEMQMTMNYSGSPLVGQGGGEFAPGSPEPGHRAPDAQGLRRFGVAHPVRLFEVLNRPTVALLLYAGPGTREEEFLDFEKAADAVVAAGRGNVDVHVVVAPDACVPDQFALAVHRDADGRFRAAYGVDGSAAYVVRPDGHVGFRCAPVSSPALAEHLALVYA